MSLKGLLTRPSEPLWAVKLMLVAALRLLFLADGGWPVAGRSVGQLVAVRTNVTIKMSRSLAFN